MSVYSELELKYARPIAHALLENTGFRQWLLAGTKHENDALEALPIGEEQRSLRSPGIKNPYWFNYFCSKDRKCACWIGDGLETDILLIFKCATGHRFGLHIEIKRPDDELRDGQAESYPRRAACWVNPNTRQRTVSPHNSFVTVLICGRNLATDERIQFFDKVVFHEDVAQHLSIYPEV